MTSCKREQCGQYEQHAIELALWKDILEQVLSCPKLTYLLNYTLSQTWVVSNLSYASPVWWGFTSAANRDVYIGAFLRQSTTLSFRPATSPMLGIICSEADDNLFTEKTSNSYHFLPSTETGHALFIDTAYSWLHSFNSNNFTSIKRHVNRMLYTELHWGTLEPCAISPEAAARLRTAETHYTCIVAAPLVVGSTTCAVQAGDVGPPLAIRNYSGLLVRRMSPHFICWSADSWTCVDLISADSLLHYCSQVEE